MPSLHLPHSRRGLLAIGAAAALVGGAAAYRKVAAQRASDQAGDAAATGAATTDPHALGWGSLEAPPQKEVSTPDGAELAVWDLGRGPTVVLPHCWACSHAIWVPVARRLVESGHRV